MAFISILLRWWLLGKKELPHYPSEWLFIYLSFLIFFFYQTGRTNISPFRSWPLYLWPESITHYLFWALTLFLIHFPSNIVISLFPLLVSSPSSNIHWPLFINRIFFSFDSSILLQPVQRSYFSFCLNHQILTLILCNLV